MFILSLLFLPVYSIDPNNDQVIYTSSSPTFYSPNNGCDGWVFYPQKLSNSLGATSGAITNSGQDTCGGAPQHWVQTLYYNCKSAYLQSAPNCYGQTCTISGLTATCDEIPYFRWTAPPIPGVKLKSVVPSLNGGNVAVSVIISIEVELSYDLYTSCCCQVTKISRSDTLIKLGEDIKLFTITLAELAEIFGVPIVGETVLLGSVITKLYTIVRDVSDLTQCLTDFTNEMHNDMNCISTLALLSLATCMQGALESIRSSTFGPSNSKTLNSMKQLHLLDSNSNSNLSIVPDNVTIYPILVNSYEFASYSPEDIYYFHFLEDGNQTINVTDGATLFDVIIWVREENVNNHTIMFNYSSLLAQAQVLNVQNFPLVINGYLLNETVSPYQPSDPTNPPSNSTNSTNDHYSMSQKLVVGAWIWFGVLFSSSLFL